MLTLEIFPFFNQLPGNRDNPVRELFLFITAPFMAVTKPHSLMSIMQEHEGDDKKPIDDISLVRAFREGDRNAFSRLVNLYSARLFNTILRIVKNEQEAEDLTQETFLTAYRAIASFREKSSFYTWIYRIGVNKTLNYLKNKKRSLTILDGSFQGEQGPVYREIADDSQDPQKRLDTGETGKILEIALATLSENNRVVFVLREIDGFTYTEISKMLNIKEQAVRTRIHRARRELQHILKNLLK